MRDDQRDLAGQLAGAVAQQQVVEAVVVVRDEDRDALGRAAPRQAPASCAKRSRDLADRALERGAVGVDLREVEADALEELAGDRVGVLVRVEDVGAVSVEQLRERRDDAAPIGARDEERRDVRSGRSARRGILACAPSASFRLELALGPADLIG